MSGRRPRLSLRIDTHAATGDRTTVVVSGDIDAVTSQGLEGALRNALDRSIHGIEVDLSDAEFRDSSGVDALADVRRHAHQSAKDLAVQTANANGRPRAGTGSKTPFSAPAWGGKTADTNGAPPGATSRPEARAASDPHGEEDLRTEVTHLKRALQTRPVIDLARGILMASFGLSAEGAWTVLVEASQHTNTKLRYVAEELVNADEMPEPFQHQIAAAVTRLQTPQSASSNREG
ncbi:ANTAR domain-containing protein [Streptomyces sp. NPDC050982]|uniref:ANTAR domain-containing protein n=1 Tax=Streptomyces sp. NPDC050982 TaxID=3154746 RepID=UPI00340CAE15